jgi:hypothetical protein
MVNTLKLFLVFMFISLIAAGCSSSTEAQKNDSATKNASPTSPAHAKPQATPSNKFTSADIAKLKWIEGTWRGMDGDKPFYERYRIEENALLVFSLKEDGSADGDPGRFELKDGEFGKTEGDTRSAASEIGADFIQFVSATPGKGNNFRFVKQPHGWDAILEWPATADKPAGPKTYKMEPWEPKK